MAYTATKTGTIYEPGWFLAAEECKRITAMVPANHAQKKTQGDRTIVPAGAVVAGGLLYEDIDVTNGAKPGSIVIEGTVYTGRLPEGTEAGSLPAGITAIEEPTVTRPY